MSTGVALPHGCRVTHGSGANVKTPFPDIPLVMHELHAGGGSFGGQFGFIPFTDRLRLPRHVHLDEAEGGDLLAERILVLNGVGLTELGGAIVLVAPGSLVDIAPGVPHTWTACPPGVRLPDGTAGPLVDIMQTLGIAVWLFAGDEWYITDPAGPRVDHETRSIRYDPIIVPKFDNSLLDDAVKLVGVDMDFDLVKRGEDMVNAAFGTQVSATRSQPFYLDITHVEANKGEVVKRLSRHFGIPQSEVATIGDGENDVLMFRQSGYSFAMGNGSDKVKAEASDVTSANTEEGFANAMNKVLGSLG